MAPHRPSHWILIALVILAALFTLSEVHGQTLPSAGAKAMFEGRPALAGAQAGLGAQAGPPQGGLAVEGNHPDAALRLRKPRDLDLRPDMPQGDLEDPVVAANDTDMVLRPSETRTPERATR